ncbi:MAG TPA: class I SAM-dependent methyltransferase [Chitinophagaceae bacterium]|nr:class I SAM-dependent methyltransferase [Chitinophagaceae bacterium]
MSNINDTYFDGYYKEIWKTLIPDILTVKEMEFMVPYFDLQPGSRVLDLMCGYGRHALALGRKGISVTAIDNLSDYINEIKETVQKENLPVTPLLQSVVDVKTSGQYDLAICMGNSLNFFNTQDVLSIFSTISSSLRQGGHLLVNSWSLAEIVFSNHKEKNTGTIGGMEFSNESKILFQPSRMEIESTIIAPDGTKETKQAIDYIYSINEMESLLRQTGLALEEVYSIPGKKKFSLGEPRAYIVAVKI